jgi:hypothetical protein
MQEQLPRAAMLALKNTAFGSIMLALNSPELKFLCNIRVKLPHLVFPSVGKFLSDYPHYVILNFIQNKPNTSPTYYNQ